MSTPATPVGGTGTSTATGADQAPSKAWAVIQTGYIDSTGEMTVFQGDSGERLPQVVRLAGSEADARKLMRRQELLANKVSAFASPNRRTSRPIYGIAEVIGPVQKAKRILTEQQKKEMADRLAKGRKAATAKK